MSPGLFSDYLLMITDDDATGLFHGWRAAEGIGLLGAFGSVDCRPDGCRRRLHARTIDGGLVIMHRDGHPFVCLTSCATLLGLGHIA